MKPTAANACSRENGSALMATFWFIAIMGLAVFGALQFVALDSQAVTAQRSLAQARRLAEMGLALGAHPKVKLGDPLLYREFDDGSSYRAIVISEEARLNPNSLLLNGDRQVLSRLFMIWGLEPPLASALTDALLDWVDSDSQTSFQGAEADVYAAMGRRGLPFNRPFLSLDEMRLVRGMDRVEALNPSWRDAFTLWTFGEIDVNGAAPDVIAATAGVTLPAAQRFTSILAGRDGIRFSSDDVLMESPEAAAQLLGIAPSPLLGIHGLTRRVESIGEFGLYRRRLFIITRSNSVLSQGELPAVQ